MSIATAPPKYPEVMVTPESALRDAKEKYWLEHGGTMAEGFWFRASVFANILSTEVWLRNKVGIVCIGADILSDANKKAYRALLRGLIASCGGAESVCLIHENYVNDTAHVVINYCQDHQIQFIGFSPTYNLSTGVADDSTVVAHTRDVDDSVVQTECFYGTTRQHLVCPIASTVSRTLNVVMAMCDAYGCIAAVSKLEPRDTPRISEALQCMRSQEIMHSK